MLLPRHRRDSGPLTGYQDTCAVGGASGEAYTQDTDSGCEVDSDEDDEGEEVTQRP